MSEGKLFLGASRTNDDVYQQAEFLDLKYANRHGLITGATGTGKTVTLQILAESFSSAGVPVFCADVKGDLSGLAALGTTKDFLEKRAETIKFDDFDYQQFPAIFWDLFGKKGHPIRTTISEMGPLLIARLLDLNNTQEGVLNIAFRIADEEGLLLLDLKDLQALLAHIADRAKELSSRYGTVSRRSVGSIQRSLLMLEEQGAEMFFGEPALKISDIMRTTPDGRGAINVLAADQLMMNPRLYATFLLWLLSELFQELPEIGDSDKPRLVFFFDEAHLLFDEAPKILIERVEQVVRLIRSKGVGVYFVTQNPLDVPDSVLSQLGNRIQHALRAYTPREQKAVKVAADTFRPNPDFDCFEAITKLGVGEALVSTLGKKGIPSVVQRTLIRPPSSRLGPIKEDERDAVIKLSPVLGLYDETVDRESAYEMLRERAAEAVEQEAERQEREAERERLEEEQERQEKRQEKRETRRKKEREYSQGRKSSDRRRSTPSRGRTSSSKRRSSSRGRKRQSFTETAVKSVIRAMGSSLGRTIIRGILGSLRR